MGVRPHEGCMTCEKGVMICEGSKKATGDVNSS